MANLGFPGFPALFGRGLLVYLLYYCIGQFTGSSRSRYRLIKDILFTGPACMHDVVRHASSMLHVISLLPPSSANIFFLGGRAIQ